MPALVNYINDVYRFKFIIQFRLFCLLDILNIKIYKAVVLPVVLNDYEEWSLTLREERRQGVF
jgi:hypothetical protein